MDDLTSPSVWLGSVLIADGYPDAARALGLLLENYGFQCLIAQDGAEALELAERQRPSAVLLELDLARLNGKIVAQRLRGTSWGKEVFLAAVTKSNCVGDRLDAELAGIECYFVKPILSPAELIRPLAKHVLQSRQGGR